MTHTANVRREREKEEMRQLIVDTAIKIYLEEGYEKLSLRGIAQRIEYVPTAIYRYFKSKDDLYHAMHEWAFKQLMLEFEDKLSNIKDPIDRLKGLSSIYINFAFNNPELYDLMFILKEPMCAEVNMEDWPCGQSTYKFLVDTVQEALDMSLLHAENAETLAFMFWSSTHGMISLYLRNRLRMYAGEDIYKLIFYTEEMILKQFLVRPSYVPFQNRLIKS